MSSSCPFQPPRFRVLTPCCFLVAFSVAASRAHAQDASSPPVELPPVVVGATLIPTPESELGTSVTVISADEIAAKQQRTLPDALLDVPGLNVVQTGGPGGLTSVFIRGANSNQTKVLIDGIDVSDPSSAEWRLRFRAYPQLRSWQHRSAARAAKRALRLRRNRRRHQYRDAKGPGPMLATANRRGRLVRNLQSDRQGFGLGRLAELFPGIRAFLDDRHAGDAAGPSFRSGARSTPTPMTTAPSPCVLTRSSPIRSMSG